MWMYLIALSFELKIIKNIDFLFYFFCHNMKKGEVIQIINNMTDFYKEIVDGAYGNVTFGYGM